MLNYKSFKSKAQILNFIYSLIKTVQQLHGRNIFHFDLKPENILYEDGKFQIIDFGSAQHIPEKTETNSFLGAQRVATITQKTEMFSSYRYDNVDGDVIADKYDVYSIGCILFYLCTGQYMTQAFNSKFIEFDFICDKYGYDVAHLIIGMTHRQNIFRYSIENALDHPCFKESKSQYLLSLPDDLINELQYQYQNTYQENQNQVLQPHNLLFACQNRTQMVQPIRQLKRSKSLHSYNYRPKVARLNDDQFGLNIQHGLRFNHLIEQRGFLQFAQRQQLLAIYKSPLTQADQILNQICCIESFVFQNDEKFIPRNKYVTRFNSESSSVQQTSPQNSFIEVIPKRQKSPTKSLQAQAKVEFDFDFGELEQLLNPKSASLHTKDVSWSE